MKTIKIKGYKVTIQIKDTGSNYNTFVSVFAPKDKTPLCGTSQKNELDCLKWARIKIDEDLNTDMGECENFTEAENMFNL